MPRAVTFSASGPIKLEPSPKPYFICGCGLSKNFPHCDGTHKVCRDEPEGKTFVYRDGTRVEVPCPGGSPGSTGGSGSCCSGGH